jgi:hypothetical protein
MRDQSTAFGDSAAPVAPPIVCDHADDVVEVRAEPGYRLFVRFHDGTRGMVDMAALIRSPQAGVFTELASHDVFLLAGINLGAVTWPGGIDLAPDAMYKAFRESGEWVLE